MKYIVIELQTNGDYVANIVTSYDTREQADSAYYSILSAAAVSSVELHSASLLTNEGNCIMSVHYRHGENENV